MTEITRIAETDPRVLALTRARQQLAHRGTGYVPAWDELTDEEREMSLLEGRNWLLAAAEAGLLAVEREDR